MANRKTRRVPGIGTTIRMTATGFTLVSTAKGQRVAMDLPALPDIDPKFANGEARGRRNQTARALSEVAETVCQLHGIRLPQLKVNGKFAKRGKPTGPRPTGRNGYPQVEHRAESVNYEQHA